MIGKNEWGLRNLWDNIKRSTRKKEDKEGRKNIKRHKSQKHLLAKDVKYTVNKFSE